MSDKTVSVLIPAYNEQERIMATVMAVRLLPGVEQVLVADDGSGDETAKQARQAGAQVISLERNSGKGEALNHLAQLVRGEIILLVDADLGASAKNIGPLLNPVMTGEAHISVAKFPRLGWRCGFGLVKGLAHLSMNWLGAVPLEAPLSGQRAMSRQVWEQMLPLAGGFGVEMGMNFKAAKLGYSIHEVEVFLSHRQTFKDWKGFYHRSRQLCHIIPVILRAISGRV